MNVTLIDKDFKFNPSNMGNYVQGTIGIMCNNDEELLAILSHLQTLDPSQIMASEEELENKSIQAQLEVFYENGGGGTISSLEI